MSLVPASPLELRFSTRHYAMATRSIAAVVAAAIVGAGSRWAFGSFFGDSCGLLVANIIGCALIGWASSSRQSRWDQAWLTAGLCGSLTSFAGLAVLLGVGLEEQRWTFVVLWGMATLVSCGPPGTVYEGRMPSQYSRVHRTTRQLSRFTFAV